jgi:hypothetical protein
MTVGHMTAVALGEAPRQTQPKNWSHIDQHYETLRLNLRALMEELGVAA